MGKDAHDGREGRDRGAKKRAAQAIEALAVRLVASSDALSDHLPIPDEMREELALARRITAHGGRKRQIKRLAGLLRRDEATATAVQSALDAVGSTTRAERELFHHIEELRDGLCDPDRFAETLETAADELPRLDRKRLTRLAQRFHLTGDKRASREIFRRLRNLAEADTEE